jgi:hypothetical protein
MLTLHQEAAATLAQSPFGPVQGLMERMYATTKGERDWICRCNYCSAAWFVPGPREGLQLYSTPLLAMIQHMQRHIPLM